MKLDEKTGMSRQRRYQLKHLAQGKCSHCTQPKEVNDLCLDCAEKKREHRRRIKGTVRRNIGSKTYQLRAKREEPN